jgi:hypothetical protein
LRLIASSSRRGTPTSRDHARTTDQLAVVGLLHVVRSHPFEHGAEQAQLPVGIGGGRFFADVRRRGVMDGIDLAREVKMRWPVFL